VFVWGVGGGGGGGGGSGIDIKGYRMDIKRYGRILVGVWNGYKEV